jgi:hypothetical protein
MTFRETARDADPGIAAGAPGGLTTADEPEPRVALEEEADGEHPRATLPRVRRSKPIECAGLPPFWEGAACPSL